MIIYVHFHTGVLTSSIGYSSSSPTSTGPTSACGPPSALDPAWSRAAAPGHLFRLQLQQEPRVPQEGGDGLRGAHHLPPAHWCSEDVVQSDVPLRGKLLPASSQSNCLLSKTCFLCVRFFLLLPQMREFFHLDHNNRIIDHTPAAPGQPVAQAAPGARDAPAAVAVEDNTWSRRIQQTIELCSSLSREGVVIPTGPGWHKDILAVVIAVVGSFFPQWTPTGAPIVNWGV